MELYAIMTEDGLDQVCESIIDLKREVKELKAMDIGKVWYKTFNSWEQVDNFECKLQS